MMTTKQREGENLAEDTWQFKTAKDVLESYIGGALILTKYAKGMVGYIDKDKASFEEYCKKDCLHSCIWRIIKQSTVLSCKNLVQQKLLGNEQYPKTIAEAKTF